MVYIKTKNPKVVLVRDREQRLIDIECPNGFAIIIKQHRGYINEGLVRCHEVFAYHLGKRCAFWFPVSYIQQVVNDPST